MTPPNWARTPDAATTSCRNSPSGSPRITAQASSPPMIAPAIAVPRASWIERTSASTDTPSLNSPAMLSNVNAPWAVVKAPIATTSVGTIMNSPKYAKNGTRAT